MTLPSSSEAQEQTCEISHRIVLPSESFAVRRALDSVQQALEPLCLDVEEKGTIELVLAEAMNNIVEHAYEEQPHGTIELSLKKMHNGVNFELFDQGKPMPEGELPLGRAPDPDTALGDLPEGGFGWFLIRDLAHDLKYERLDKGNLLCFRLAIA